MLSPRRPWLKTLIPIFVIAMIAAVHAHEQQRGTVASCAGSGSCGGDLSQPLLEVLQPR